MFVRGLLDLTDNVVDGEVVPPARTVRYDGDDPYLVVAADKGTATFSDTANAVAAEYAFWLGDAFASGGSDGYDHKAMGITARGAWESVRSHARVLGKDADLDELTVVGIGDMSGDVFGNGLLRSPHVKLIAAFDHRHVFVDPEPRSGDVVRRAQAPVRHAPLVVGRLRPGAHLDRRRCVPAHRQVDRGDAGDARSARHRRRTADTDRVDQGDAAGAGRPAVERRHRHVREGVDRDRTARSATAPTTRCASTAAELRCRMVGEGGNLGFTQLGRIEYALGGGLIYTDAIDNSAGVDCSDHEVNIKILLGDVVAAGEMTIKQRNNLLDEMTDEVAELVLDNNRAQTLALMIARQQSLPMVNVHARYLDPLEREGWLDRGARVPADPTSRSPSASRPAPVSPTPEFAVLIAYTKNANVAEILTSRPARRSGARSTTSSTTSRRRCASASGQYILRHRLRREIATTQLVNQMVEPLGHLVRPPHDRGHRGVGHRRRPGLGRRARGARLPGVVGRDRRAHRPRPRRPARAVPRLPARRRALLAVVPAPPPSTGRHRRSRSTASASRCRRSTTGLADCLRGPLRDAVDAMTERADRAGCAGRAGRPLGGVAAAAHDVRRDRARRAGRRRAAARRAPATGRCSTGSN